MYCFFPAQQASTEKLATFFQKIQKRVYALRVNEISITSSNTLIENIFALESEKDSKNDERSLF